MNNNDDIQDNYNIQIENIADFTLTSYVMIDEFYIKIE